MLLFLYHLLVGMHAEIFNFIKRNRLVFRRRGIWWLITQRICAESADFDFACCHGTYGIYYDGEIGVLVKLVCVLCANINTRKPAPVPGVTMIPTCVCVCVCVCARV